ncbi:PREDICTED: von Willebrand factor A domain-containing protein 3B-like [Galeopterus variegatus]|uniref:von Willebrand factor A domain-containing protein 3B-like n=1 Tax=Galeopterus variegatus TaxID=482537 RepID=A0ABM0SF90_GALVR|nr:PREDICTED: von Willebrand factor A domain-containing protein 3B-like [Galeopterus variegatus]
MAGTGREAQRALLGMAGAGVREDVFLIWREMEEACSTLAQIQRLVAEPPKSNMAPVDCESGATAVKIESQPEDTWDSKKWLQKYGLKAQKLSLYDVLADCSFRHADGVVDIKAKPENESVQTSAETKKKTVHAKYCSRFVHTPWKDGSLVHISITKEKCRWYSDRVHVVLAQIQRRINWLQDGSQILFGKVHNDCVYVLIDTSHSMKSKLDLVKDKIIQFIQDSTDMRKVVAAVSSAATLTSNPAASADTTDARDVVAVLAWLPPPQDIVAAWVTTVDTTAKWVVAATTPSVVTATTSAAKQPPSFCKQPATSGTTAVTQAAFQSHLCNHHHHHKVAYYTAVPAAATAAVQADC